MRLHQPMDAEESSVRASTSGFYLPIGQSAFEFLLIPGRKYKGCVVADNVQVCDQEKVDRNLYHMLG